MAQKVDINREMTNSKHKS